MTTEFSLIIFCF